MDKSTFADGFGRRFQVEPPSEDEGLEWLRLCLELSDAAEIEANLIARASMLASLRHPQLAAVRRIERRPGFGLIVVSEAVPGLRLADLLRLAERRWVDADLPAALFLLQEVASGLSALHQHERDACHGALGPERIVVRPDGSAVIVEVVLGAAVEPLGMTRTRLWKQYRVPLPPTAGAARFDQATDVLQLGVLALALTTGRMLGRDDFPGRLGDLVREVSAEDPLGHRAALPRALRSWLTRALQLDNRAFRSATEAEAELAAAMPASTFQPSRESAIAWVAAVTGEPASDEQKDPGTTAAECAGATKPPGSSAATGVVPTPNSSSAISRVTVPKSGAAPPPRGRSRALPSFPKSGWPVLRRVFRVSAVAASLILLWGVSYLGARSYFGLPPVLLRTGHLVVESRPAGLEVLLNGQLKGTTPISLEVPAGDYTLALRSWRSTTLLPVSVQAGTWRTERIQVRRGRLPLRSSSVGQGPVPVANPPAGK